MPRSLSNTAQSDIPHRTTSMHHAKPSSKRLTFSFARNLPLLSTDTHCPNSRKMSNLNFSCFLSSSVTRNAHSLLFSSCITSSYPSFGSCRQIFRGYYFRHNGCHGVYELFTNVPSDTFRALMWGTCGKIWIDPVTSETLIKRIFKD
jgi:hypothetical protein